MWDELYVQHITVPVKIREFSKKSRAQNEFVSNNISLDKGFLLIHVFPNGLNEENSGYVSLEFLYEEGMIEGSCTILVIDANHDTRFPRTFEFDDAFRSLTRYPPPRFFMQIEKYIARSILEGTDECLPDDTLTLQIDICVTKFLPKPYSLTRKEVRSIGSLTGCWYYVAFESEFKRLLCEESEYYKHNFENGKGVTILLDMEFVITGIGDILSGVSPIVFESVEDIIEVYMTADKYLLTTVSKTCLHFLTLCRSDFKAELLEIADKCEHLNLLELKECLRNKYDETLLKRLTDENGWSYRRRDMKLYFYFENKTTNEFDFYK